MITIKEKEQDIDWLDLPYGTLFKNDENSIYVVVRSVGFSIHNSQVYAMSIDDESGFYYDSSITKIITKNWKLLPNTTLEYKKP